MASTRLYEHYNADVVDRGWAIFEDPTMGPIMKKNKFEDLLKEDNAIEELDWMHPSKVLVHPSNRTGLGVNAFNAHRNAAMILKVGADLSLLQAWVIQMSPKRDVRAKQVAFNQVLIDLSRGLLAPINGDERVLSVSTGHTFAICRAANNRCKTSAPTLADADGLIDAQRMRNDIVFATMLEKGWPAKEVSWQAEET